jgi:Cu+-exporting ATPase
MTTRKVIDPVCKMEIHKGEAMATSTYKRRKYYFCSTGCKNLFDQNPEQYMAEEKK